MKSQKPEIIEADPVLRYRWLMAISLYLLCLLWFEPVLDQLLSWMIFEPTAEGLAALNEQKQMLASWGYALLRSIPLLLFLWLGWQIVRSQQLPPPGVRLPIAAMRIKGAKARVIGMGMVAVALLSLLRELGGLL